MSDIESRLREAFRTDAASIKAVRNFVPQPRGLARWAGTCRLNNIAVPVAAATAVAAIAFGATVVVPKLRSGDAVPRTVPAGDLAAGYPGGVMAAQGPPKFVVVITASAAHDRTYPTTLAVIATATGRVVGRLAPPAPGQFFQAVAAAGSDREFAVEASRTAACETWFYTFSLSAQGKPGNLRPYQVAHVPGLPTRLEHPSLAASGDDKTLAFATTPCPRPINGHVGGLLGVADAASGQARTWHYVYPAAPETLSLSANGRQLELSSTASRPVHGTATVDEAIWLLSTSAPAGQLGQRYRLVRPAVRGSDSGFQPSVLSPTGRITYAESQRILPRKPSVRTLITAYRTATGKPVRILSSRLTGDLTLNASGRYLLTFPGANAGPSQPHKAVRELVGLDLATGKIITVPRNPSGRVINAAW